MLIFLVKTLYKDSRQVPGVSGRRAATLHSASHLHLLLTPCTNACINLQWMTKTYLKPFFCFYFPPHQNTYSKFSCLKYFIKAY